MKIPSYRLGLVLAFILQAGLLGWLIASRALLLMHGTEVRLAVIPVDPQDLIRGDYVELDYAAAHLDTLKLAGDDDFAIGETVYVSMADGAGAWAPTAVSHLPPTAGAVFLRGTVSDLFNEGPCSVSYCARLSVDYDLDKFFVPEGTGHALELLRRDQLISVDVAVAGDGRAVLKRLLVNGKPDYEEGLY